MAESEELVQRAKQMAALLAEAKPMRRGVVGERYMKCGKASCACHQDGGARHGPYFALTRGVAGATRSKYLTAEQAVEARRQVEAGREFRRRVDAYWEVCEQWADAELDAPEAASQEAAKKGASKRRSRPRSSPKSKRS
jgi:hypothetical protein